MIGQISFKVVIQRTIHPLETSGIEKVLTITEAELNTAHLAKCPHQNLVHFLCQASLHFHMKL